MKRKQLLHIIGDISEDYIAEAAPEVSKNKKPTWMKWIAAAACFTLLFAIGLPVIKHFTQGSDKQTIDNVLLVEYDNAYYEVVEHNPLFLERRGIKTEITKESAGEHLSYLKRADESERSNYIISEEETDCELLDYAPAAQEAVKVLRDGEQYFAAVFCNYLIPDTESLPFEKVFEIYGVTTADDIKSIVSVKTDNEYRASGTAVMDRVLISSFYDEILALEQYSENKFYKTQFTYEDENKAEEYHRAFADDRKDFMIETMDGLKFTVSYFPTFDWVRGNETQTYYRMSPALETWIDTNLTR